MHHISIKSSAMKSLQTTKHRRTMRRTLGMAFCLIFDDNTRPDCLFHAQSPAMYAVLHGEATV
jgi:hypothetical protein